MSPTPLITLTATPGRGTRVVGSRFGQALLEPRSARPDAYPHQAPARLASSHGWWLHAKLDDEILRYYAEQAWRRFGIRLHTKTQWGAHISAIRGEEPTRNLQSWGSFDGETIQARYSHEIFTNGSHWWLNVQSPRIDEIRDFFGLEVDSRWLHLTIGRP